ncbi:triphosphoribosyl-dephospho-CoA synthase MdcB [Paraburkholderia edwinii]|uniref:triphosphoribosyl-dephospho-CoA synthase MdcB n=1 Tax=Paraburkholderia edwinii TaxID=2861782 RepID=UPI001FEC1BB3|nr:triphosphoribosyl-dephospho-CoA synthase MdcB [Paraburkholderia edwinii]
MNRRADCFPETLPIAGHPTPSHVADLAVACLLAAIATWPKPGLVSHLDNGGHTDIDAQILRDSAVALEPFFAELAHAGTRNARMPALRRIGVRAEHRLLNATGGVNTHHGAIFGLGLLCAAAGVRIANRAREHETLGGIVARLWGSEIMAGARRTASHGAAVARRYGAGGARAEAAQGFPKLYQVGLPALRLASGVVGDQFEEARVHACFALLARLEDTNLLYRGGIEGLRFAQQEARAFLAAGSIWQREWWLAASAIHARFVARKLSPGGTANLLAMSLFVDRWDTGPTL